MGIVGGAEVNSNLERQKKTKQISKTFFSSFLPHVPGAHPKREAAARKASGYLWEGPVLFGRGRESRSSEAAGRGNWPEAVPRKMRGRKRDGLPNSVRMRKGCSRTERQGRFAEAQNSRRA